MIWWRTDTEYAPVTFFVSCNDEFSWGTADAEEVTAENLHELKEALDDTYKVAGRPGQVYAGELFVARVRKMRPQGACYERYSSTLRPLFDACGPEREVNFLNPKPYPER